ncbi:MAG: 50S ribosomal protein L30e [Candidatus Micrarchaeia archaeon]|jgi:large subunit ribosomal protein L30e
MTIDVIKAIRMAVDTGKVELGANKTEKQVKNGNGKLVIISNNCTKELKTNIEYYSKLSDIPLYQFKGSNMELGEACGKPFSISAMVIFEQGDSNIFMLIK